VSENKTEVKKKKEAEITLETFIQRDTNQEFSKIDNEVVMLSLNNGEYYALNEIASNVWDLLESKISLIDIISRITEEYNIDYQTCRREIEEYIYELYNKNLILLYD